MKWTKEDSANLRNLRNVIDSDNIRIKDIVKKELLKNKTIIHVLNNKNLELSDAEPDDYFGVNILDHYVIPKVQTHTDNFICYETQSKSIKTYNSTIKTQQLIFYILCEEKNILDKDTNLPRHDLLALLIQDLFNFRVFYGNRIQLVSDVAGITDSSYNSRTLTFEMNTDSNLVKTINGKPAIINKIHG